MIKPLLFVCSAWHDMFVLSEGFIHKTRLTSLLVCREGVSPFVWLQWHDNLWQRQSAVRFRLEMAHFLFRITSNYSLEFLLKKSSLYVISYWGAFYWHWQTKARNRNLYTVMCYSAGIAAYRRRISLFVVQITCTLIWTKRI